MRWSRSRIFSRINSTARLWVCWWRWSASISLVPYLVLQFTGLGVIVQAASYGAVPKTVAIIIGAAVVTLYVIISGIRGSAWTAVVKDIMIISVAAFLGFYLPIHYFGGMSQLFEAVNIAKPGFLAFAAHGQSLSWFVSTTLLTALGFFMWPHSFGSSSPRATPQCSAKTLSSCRSISW